MLSFDLDNNNEKYNYIEKTLKELDLFNITPINVLQILNDLKIKSSNK